MIQSTMHTSIVEYLDTDTTSYDDSLPGMGKSGLIIGGTGGGG